MCFKYLLNRKYTAYEYMKTNKFLSNSLLQFKMQPSTDLQNVAKIQNNIYKINFKFSITNVSSYFIHVFLQYFKQIEGAFHLRKKTGNFGGSKSGISDW